jgi:hypothetical protein
MFNRFRKHGLDAEARAVKNAVDALQNAITAKVNGIEAKTEQKAEVKTDSENFDINIRYSLRTKPDPKKTITAYKLFNQREDGNLYPLYINPDNDSAYVQIGKWYDADEGAYSIDPKNGRKYVKAQGGLTKLAYRPGWHSGSVPFLDHIGVRGDDGKQYLPKNFVWAEVEISADKNYQDEADKNGTQARDKQLDYVPTDGFYKYKTNSKAAADQEWYISGALKVVRIISDEEAFRISGKRTLRDNSITKDIKVSDRNGIVRKAEVKTDTKFSLPDTDSEGRKLTKEQMEFFKDSKARDEQGRLLVVYHGTNSSFTRFKKEYQSQYSQYSPGFFFAESKEMARLYGDNIIPVYLNATYGIEEKRADRKNGIIPKDKIDYIHDKSRGIWIVFEPNQIKLTTNLNPSKNEDIRYSLPPTNPKRSEGELQKYVANKTKERVYSKSDAESLINEIVKQRLDFGDRYGAGFKNSKSLDNAVNAMWIALNRASKANQAYIAMDMADFVLESIVLKDYYQDEKLAIMREHAQNTLNALRPYYHKIKAKSLDYIAEDVKFVFGDKKSFALWKAPKYGIAIDKMVDELQWAGFPIEPDTPVQDIFIKMETARREAVAILNSEKEAQKKTVKDLVEEGVISKDALNAMRNEIASTIMDTFANGGEISTYGKLMAKVKNTVKGLRETLETERQRSNELLKLFQNINRAKNLQKYTQSTSPLPEELRAIIKPITKIVTHKGNLNKNVRIIMREYTKQITIDGTTQPIYDFIFGGKNLFEYQINMIANGKGQLTVQEIQWLNAIIESFVFGINNYNKEFWENKRQDALLVSAEGVSEIQNTKKLSDKGVIKAMNSVKHWMSAPVWRFLRLGMYNENSVAYKMFLELKKGVDKQSEFNMRVAKHFEAFFQKNKKQVREWRKPKYVIGDTKITAGQAISLYMLAQREQARGHMFNDGDKGVVRFVLDKAGLSNRQAFQAGTDVEISVDDIKTLYNQFSEAEKEFVMLAQKFFDKIARDAKVETDTNLYGVSNVEEGHYFPIRVSDDELFKELGKDWDSIKDLFTVYSPSFNKQTQPNARNKIVIENVLDVVNRHARQMSVYYGLATPIRAISKIYNVKHKSGEFAGTSLRNEIAKVDPDFERYLNKLFLDIQGQRPSRESFDKFLSQIRRMGVTAALGLNPKVLLNQFVSLFASRGNGISYKNIMIGFKSMFGKKDFETLYKYSPMAYERARAGSNIDVGLLKEEAGFVGVSNRLSEITTGLIGKVDSLVVYAVWNAAIEQTRNDAKYEYKSDEHYKTAAALLEDTLIKTQANYTPLYRPEILRSQNSLLQLSTMFMSEPLQVFSQLAAAVERAAVARYELKNARTEAEKAAAEKKVKAANKYARGVATAVLVDSILLSLIAILANYVRGKDDEEEFWEQLGMNMLENIVGMLPFVRDIYSFLQGYDVSNMFYTGLENIGMVFRSGGKIFTGDFTLGDLRKTVIGVSQTFGIPLRNLEAYVVGTVNLFSPETAYKYWDIFYKQNYRQNLKKSIEKGDDKMAATILTNMIKDRGVTPKEDVIAETLRLYKAGYDTIPKAASQSVSVDGVSYNLTSKQYKQFVDTYKKAGAEVSKLISSSEYKAFDDEAKGKAMRYVYDAYYNKALNEVLGIKNKSTAIVQIFDVTQYAIFKAFASVTEANKDKKGNPITASKKKKIFAYVQKLNIPNAQKALLLNMEGYTINDGELKGFSATSAKRAVINYINASSLSSEEKEALAKTSGFNIKNGRVVA